MKLLMYGAGSIGRGFIGALFALGGYEVVFVDVNKEIVSAMNEKRGYTLHIAAEPAYSLEIQGISAVNGMDEAAVIAEIASCDIMATSLGGAILERVSPLIARGLERRAELSAGPLDILICENLKDAPEHLHGWLSRALPPDRQDILDTVGLVETAIGRMVPVADPADNPNDPLFVRVEAYDFLPVDAKAFKSVIPNLEKLVACDPFSFYEERKLYLHNMGHALCAYVGQLCGYEYIWQAVNDPYIRLLVQGAMTESASMLSIEYGVPFADIYRHAENLLLRFGNRALGDTCERVARDPLRKLSAQDRFAGPLRKCCMHHIQPVFISVGLAAALLGLEWERDAATKALHEVCGLDPVQKQLVLRLYDQLAADPSPAAAFSFAEKLKQELYGQTL